MPGPVRGSDYRGFRPQGLLTGRPVDRAIKFMAYNNTRLHGSPALCPFVKPTAWWSGHTAKFPGTTSTAGNRKAGAWKFTSRKA